MTCCLLQAAVSILSDFSPNSRRTHYPNAGLQLSEPQSLNLKGLKPKSAPESNEWCKLMGVLPGRKDAGRGLGWLVQALSDRIRILICRSLINDQVPTRLYQLSQA